MSNNLAHVRAREAAENWLADRKLALPTPPRVSAAFVETALVDAYVAGFTETDGNGRQFACCFFDLEGRSVLTVNSARGVPDTVEVNGRLFRQEARTEDEVNAIIAGLIRDAQVHGLDDDADERADDAAKRIAAYLGAIHREEQDQWADERRIGQQQLDDARALMVETAELLRGYEAHHRDKMEPLAPDSPERIAAEAKVDRNALAAARLEAWVAGEDRYPVSLNPAEVLRGIATETAAVLGLGVDHDSFDQAARSLDQMEFPPAADGEPIPYVGGLVVRCRECGAAQTVLRYTEGMVEAPGEDTAVAHGQVVGLHPEIVEALRASAGETDGDRTVEACRDRFDNIENFTSGPVPIPGRPHHRPQGVADLLAFRLTTGDPRFDPLAPVCVNGYLYHPAKEN